MKNIKFNGKKYNLPQNWNEVNFKQWKEIVTIDNTSLLDMEYQIKILSILSGVAYADLLTVSKNDIDKAFNSFDFSEDDKMIQHFTIKNSLFKSESFYAIDLTEDVADAFITYTQYEQLFKEDFLASIPFKIAITFRKKGESFADVQAILNERAKYFEENLSAATILQIRNFFLGKWKVSELHMQVYTQLKQEVENKKLYLEQSFLKDTVGFRRFLGWQKVMLLRFSIGLIRSLVFFSTTYVGRLILMSCRMSYSSYKTIKNKIYKWFSNR